MITLAKMGYAGAGMFAELKYPEPLALISMEGMQGFGAESLAGYEKFNRLIKCPWKKNTTDSVDSAYGYDRMQPQEID